MATSLDNLNAALLSLDALIAQVYASPKPTYSIDGKSVDWNGYRSGLLKERADLIQAIIQAEGPTELHVQGNV